MAERDEQLVVRSHVARDLLQTAAPFRDEAKAIWEYVANGLQYVDDGTHPVVKVTVETARKRIAITDNGRGMDWADLCNYFVMHGLNADRQAGHAGRGRFGTGKCAAFGIAGLLRVTTVRSGRRSRVELRREDIPVDGSGEEIPLRVLEREISTNDPNGTVIEIEHLHLWKLDVLRIKQHIEGHLTRWTRNARVMVNGEACVVVEPTVIWQRRFVPSDVGLDDETCQRLGGIELVVKVSQDWLEEERRGIAIYSKGIWHETRRDRGGAHAKIFGEIDVPQLEEDDSPIPAFDGTRSMQLNGNNELVRAIYAFIDPAVRQVRKTLEDDDRARRAGDESRRLAQQAERIASIINQHFRSLRHQLPRNALLRAMSADTTGGARPQKGSQSGIVAGEHIPAEVAEAVAAPPNPDGGTQGAAGRDEPSVPPLAPAEEGPPSGQRKDDLRPTTIRGGGFKVLFDYRGEGQRRALFDVEERTITINLDHPLLAALYAHSIDSQAFQKVAYEIALCEYAIGCTRERARHEGCYLDVMDAIEDLSDTLDYVCRSAKNGDV